MRGDSSSPTVTCYQEAEGGRFKLEMGENSTYMMFDDSYSSDF